MKKFAPKIILFTLVILIITSCIYFFYHFDLDLYLKNEEAAIRFITSFGPLSILVFILLQVAQVILAPIPGDVTGFIGGYLYGSVPGAIYSTIGLTLGSWLAFYVARLYGMPFVEKIIRPEIIKKYDYFMEHKGLAVSFVFFLIPGFPKDFLCYIIGLSHMKTRVFLVISTLGRLFGTILLSIAGSSVRNHQNSGFYTAAGIILLTGLLAYWYRDRLHGILKHLHRKKSS